MYLLVVRSQRCLAKPHVPVQTLGHGFFRQSRVALRAGQIIHAQHDLDRAEAALADEFAGRAIGLHRPLLRAHLENALVLAGRIDQHAAFGDVERKRLFRVNVLAGLTGTDADQNAQRGPACRRSRRRGLSHRAACGSPGASATSPGDVWPIVRNAAVRSRPRTPLEPPRAIDRPACSRGRRCRSRPR